MRIQKATKPDVKSKIKYLQQEIHRIGLVKIDLYKELAEVRAKDPINHAVEKDIEYMLSIHDVSIQSRIDEVSELEEYLKTLK